MPPGTPPLPLSGTRAALLALVLFSAPTFAFNHPEIKWRTVPTEHFEINYYNRTEPLVYAAWKIAEQAYEALAPIYDYGSPRKIQLSLADYDDYSNGWADWTAAAIMIWVPDMRFDMRGNTTWLRNVITHELAHVMSLEKQKKMQTIAWTLSIGYYSPSANVTYQEPFQRMTLLPDWLAEGVAQRGAERLKSDRWDSRRDMVLRCAVLSGQALSVEEMGHFNHDGRGNEMVYNHGYSFSAYLERMVGTERFHQVLKDAARERFRFADYFHLKTGLTLERAYRGWVDSLRATYESSRPKAPTAAKPVWSKGFLNAQPRVSPDGTYWGWLTNHRDDGYRTDLVIARTGSRRPVRRIPYAHTSWAFSSDSKGVYFIRSRRPNRFGSFFNDLYYCKVRAGGMRRLTRGARVYDVAASPDGSALAVTRFRDGVYSLHLYKPATGEWSTLAKGELGNPFVGPSFDPANPRQLAVGRVVGGVSNLYIVGMDSGTVRPVIATAAQEETPHWADDGRIYYSADYDGVFNVYSVRPDGSDRRRHTSVLGGAFAPHAGPKGGLLFVEYTTDGFRVVSAGREGTAYEVVDTASAELRPLPTPSGRVRISSKPYKGRLLRSVWEGMTFIEAYIDEPIGDSGRSYYGQGGIALLSYRSDALYRKWFELGVYAGLIGGVEHVHPDSGSGLSPAALSDVVNAGVKQRDGRASSLAGPRTAVQQRLSRPIEAATLPAGYNQGPFGGTGETDSASGTMVYLPSIFLQPYIYYDNASLKPTLGLSATGALSLGMSMGVPIQYVVLSPFCYWHVARDLYAGVVPYIELGPAYGFEYYISVPVWLQWIALGYYEEDYHYTMRNVTDVSVDVGPMIFPAQGGGAAFALYQQLNVEHGFPVARSASLVLGIADTLYYSADEFALLTMDSSSTLFLKGSASARFVFPIVKSINRGKHQYADALYGALFYRGSILADQAFVRQANMDQVLDALGEFGATPHAAVEHSVGMSLNMGVFKDYLFYRMLSLAGSYELLSRTYRTDLSLSF